MERQWNRRGVTWTWEENPLCVVGSCQWRGDVGSCLENSNVLPFVLRSTSQLFCSLFLFLFSDYTANRKRETRPLPGHEHCHPSAPHASPAMQP